MQVASSSSAGHFLSITTKRKIIITCNDYKTWEGAEKFIYSNGALPLLQETTSEATKNGNNDADVTAASRVTVLTGGRRVVSPVKLHYVLCYSLSGYPGSPGLMSARAESVSST